MGIRRLFIIEIWRLKHAFKDFQFCLYLQVGEIILQVIVMVMHIDLTFLEGNLAIGRKNLNRHTLIQQFHFQEFIRK